MKTLGTFSVLMLAATACSGDGGRDDAAGGPNQNTTRSEGNPVRGGHLTYGVEADTANPWAPYRASCSAPCLLVLSAISDSLFAVDSNGDTVPYLAESVEHNAGYTEWTITVRDGIRFHDDTPLDAEAVRFNLETCAGSPLTASAFTSIGSITADGRTVTIRTRDGKPWVALPAHLSYGACGHMFSKKWLQSLPDVPHRKKGGPLYDAGLAATPANGDPAAPVGLGEFAYKSYEPGNGNGFTAVRNDDYWRGPNGITGEKLPHLDSVEFVVAADNGGRSNALRSGQLDIMQTRDGDTLTDSLQDGEYETVTSDRFGATTYQMINVAAGTNKTTGERLDPEGANADNPLLTLACRKALAHAVDLDRLVEDRRAGIARPANGPFPPGSSGYLKDTGYPAYDVAAARAEMDECLRERGTDRIEVTLNATSDPGSTQTNQLIISMWRQALGDRVNVDTAVVEQGRYIGLGLNGDFELIPWSGHAGTDPDEQFPWWTSSSSAPIGEPALNFGRFSDGVIDRNLAIIRTNPDKQARTAAAEAINRRFGEQVYNLWLNWEVWGIVSGPHVNDQVNSILPGGAKGVGLAFSALHPLGQVWCEKGRCE
ncbi:ABC transporter substrate-binding protein [Actinomadura sp. 3N407]|uniref:ABC transporter substrate-binding protein n=1 Tax=Actinomadura sp. 3N407 TaxID=3457423 RepID=UPI003FCE1951